jgi:hypothetical protein
LEFIFKNRINNAVNESIRMKNLFEKTNINNIEVKNRVIKVATWDEMADDDGHINNALIKQYENLAKGGVEIKDLNFKKPLDNNT